MKWFADEKKSLFIPKDKRIVLLVGGGGVLGEALLSTKPKDVFIFNITKSSDFNDENIITYHFDVATETENAIWHISTLTDSIDVLINAAYISHFTTIDRLGREEFTEEFLLNVFTPMRLTKLCVDYFWSKKSQNENVRNARKVINISSGAAFGKTARPELASYSGTKAALNVMTEYLHEYTQTYGVGAHIVAPGSLQVPEVMTKTLESIWKLQSEKIAKFSLEKIF